MKVAVSALLALILVVTGYVSYVIFSYDRISNKKNITPQSEAQDTAVDYAGMTKTGLNRPAEIATVRIKPACRPRPRRT